MKVLMILLSLISGAVVGVVLLALQVGIADSGIPVYRREEIIHGLELLVFYFGGSMILNVTAGIIAIKYIKFAQILLFISGSLGLIYYFRSGNSIAFVWVVICIIAIILGSLSHERDTQKEY